MILRNFGLIAGTWGIFSSPGDCKLTPDGLSFQ